MKEEIKEILELYKNDDIEYYNLVSDLGYDKLLDCITNLQEENKNLKDYLKIMEKGKDNNLNRFLDYKSRNEKAIEYIHNHQLVFELSSKKQIQYWFDMFYIDLLNILKGDKDE